MWATLLETLIQCDESKNNSKCHRFPLPPNSFYFSRVWIPSGQILKKIRSLKKIYHGLPYTKIDVDVFWLWLPTHAPWWCVKREKLHTTYLSHHWEASHMARDTATMSHALESHFLSVMLSWNPCAVLILCTSSHSALPPKVKIYKTTSNFVPLSWIAASMGHSLTGCDKAWCYLWLSAQFLQKTSFLTAFYIFWDYHLTMVPLLPFSLSNPLCFHALFNH